MIKGDKILVYEPFGIWTVQFVRITSYGTRFDLVNDDNDVHWSSVDLDAFEWAELA